MENKVEFQEIEEEIAITKSLTEENKVIKKKRKPRRRKAKNSGSVANMFSTENLEQSELASVTDTKNASRVGDSKAVGFEPDNDKCVIQKNGQNYDHQFELCGDQQNGESSKRKKRKNRKRKSKNSASPESATFQNSDSSNVVSEGNKQNDNEVTSIKNEFGVLVVLECGEENCSTNVDKNRKVCEVNEVDSDEDESLSQRITETSDQSVIFEEELENFKSITENDKAESLKSDSQSPLENDEAVFNYLKSQENEKDNSTTTVNEISDVNPIHSLPESSAQYADLVLHDSEKGDNENNDKISEVQNVNNLLSGENDNAVIDGTESDDTNSSSGRDEITDSFVSGKMQGNSVVNKIDINELNNSCISVSPESFSQNYDITNIPEDKKQISAESDNGSLHDSSGSAITSEDDHPEAKEGENQNNDGCDSNSESNGDERLVPLKDTERIIPVSENTDTDDHRLSDNSFQLVDKNEQKTSLMQETEVQSAKNFTTPKLDEQRCQDLVSLEFYEEGSEVATALEYSQQDDKHGVTFGQEEKKDEDVFIFSQDEVKAVYTSDEKPFIFMSSFAVNVDWPSTSSEVVTGYKTHHGLKGQSQSLKRPPSRGELMPQKRRKKEIKTESKGLIEKFAAIQVLCFLLACHAICALLSVFKRRTKQVFGQ